MICFLEENGCFFEKMKFDNIGVSQFNNIFVFFLYIFSHTSTRNAVHRVSTKIYSSVCNSRILCKFAACK